LTIVNNIRRIGGNPRVCKKLLREASASEISPVQDHINMLGFARRALGEFLWSFYKKRPAGGFFLPFLAVRRRRLIFLPFHAIRRRRVFIFMLLFFALQFTGGVSFNRSSKNKKGRATLWSSGLFFVFWSGREDLNLRPLEPHSEKIGLKIFT
jgi:hypothetical protein